VSLPVPAFCSPIDIRVPRLRDAFFNAADFDNFLLSCHVCEPNLVRRVDDDTASPTFTSNQLLNVDRLKSVPTPQHTSGQVDLGESTWRRFPKQVEQLPRQPKAHLQMILESCEERTLKKNVVQYKSGDALQEICKLELDSANPKKPQQQRHEQHQELSGEYSKWSPHHAFQYLETRAIAKPKKVPLHASFGESCAFRPAFQSKWATSEGTSDDVAEAFRNSTSAQASDDLSADSGCPVATATLGQESGTHGSGSPPRKWPRTNPPEALPSDSSIAFLTARDKHAVSDDSIGQRMGGITDGFIGQCTAGAMPMERQQGSDISSATDEEGWACTFVWSRYTKFAN